MGKGPGKWQRLVLDALVDSEWVAIHTLTPAPRTPAKRAAISRAAHTLARRGLIGVGVRTLPRMDGRESVGRDGVRDELQHAIAFRLGCDPRHYDGRRGTWGPHWWWGDDDDSKCYKDPQGPVVTLTKEGKVER